MKLFIFALTLLALSVQCVDALYRFTCTQAGSKKVKFAVESDLFELVGRENVTVTWLDKNDKYIAELGSHPKKTEVIIKYYRQPVSLELKIMYKTVSHDSYSKYRYAFRNKTNCKKQLKVLYNNPILDIGNSTVKVTYSTAAPVQLWTVKVRPKTMWNIYQSECALAVKNRSETWADAVRLTRVPRDVFHFKSTNGTHIINADFRQKQVSGYFAFEVEEEYPSSSPFYNIKETCRFVIQPPDQKDAFPEGYMGILELGNRVCSVNHTCSVICESYGHKMKSLHLRKVGPFPYEEFDTETFDVACHRIPRYEFKLRQTFTPTAAAVLRYSCSLYDTIGNLVREDTYQITVKD